MASRQPTASAVVGNLASVLGRGIVVLLLLLTGCAGPRVMMPTPNVHLEPERDFYASLHRELQSTEVPLFYITDRAPETDSEGRLRYGHERSPSVAFGSAVVDLGADLSWGDLLAGSRTQSRLRQVELELREVSEIVRTPETPLPLREVDGRIVERPELAAQREEAVEEFRATSCGGSS